MKQIIIGLAIFFMHSSAYCQLFIGSGSTLALSSNPGIPSLTLQDASLINNGTFVAGLSDVYFQQSSVMANQSIGGSSVPSFDYIIIDMNDQALVLDTDIEVSGRVVFQSGDCDLNGQTTTLTDGVDIGNENNNSSFVGPNGGEVVTTVTLNGPSSENPGNIGATITSSKNLGEVTVRRTHVPVSSGGGQGINRKYTITAANNADLDATLRLSYFDKELNGTTENSLSLWRKEGNAWYGKGFSDRDATGNWVEQTGIDAFSEWTLGNVIFTPVIDLDQGQSLTIGDLFPNPSGSSTSLVQFQVNSPRDLDLHVRVIDPLGRIIHQQVQHVLAGDQYVPLQTLDWSPGMYVIQLQTADESAQLTLHKL
ncbi:MAG: T9SS type A sorting domain-containing protein [Lewinellaceae bacterium]|mgnify:CR=1 FL=1|nr:T9SS type A sorting domain-containing protein [Saprospiraceae bacterium]MCB9312914.1 T9SS type A sorting domain-containing protein [Lewinellaceae bacterium]HRW74310.1 T9SS type A sorting domain-containing protein [Saprospiraceae bacterium]